MSGPDKPEEKHRTWRAPGLTSGATTGPVPARPAEDDDDDEEGYGLVEVTAIVPREAWPSRNERRYPVIRVAAGPDLLAFARLYLDTPILVGRGDDATLRLNDSSVSRHHARLELQADGSVMVIDLGSTNGLRIDERATKRGVIFEGARLELGTVSLRLDMMTDNELHHLSKVRTRLLAAENRDPLTGLLTRAYLEDELPRVAATCARSEIPLCCLFFDLDHFKRVNDTFGHAVGDLALETVAQLALLDCRETDACLRYGGEEFVVVLQGSSAKDALRAARRLCRAVQGYDWDRSHPGLTVTISCGVAKRRINEDLGAWIGRADRAMYTAKRKGRNRALLAVGD
jgi:diguanylate cyclase (GGDEF)-like protein